MKSMMKKFTYILILMMATCGLLRAETRLVSADAFSAVVEYTMEQPEFKTNADGEQIIFLPGCQTAGEPGAPAALEHPLSLGVPEGARVKVQVLSVESEDIHDFNLAPNPVLTSSGQPGLGSYRYVKNPSHYGKAGMLPGAIASLVSVERLRQFNIAGVKVAPVQYDPLAGVLRLNKRITVKVSWDIAGRDNDSRPDQAFVPVFSKLLVNYPQCRNWKVSEKTSKAKAVDPFDGHPVWYKVKVTQEGIYRLDYDYLLRNGVDPAVIDPRTIKIFSGGSAALPKDRNIAVPDTMKQIALWVKGQEDGRFDQGDHIIFYGQDLSGWNKNSKLTTPQFFNPYTDTNCYWLTWGGDNGRRMQVRNCEPGQENLQPLQSFTDTLHFEQDKFNPFNSGEFYYWANMRRASSENSRTYSYDLAIPGVSDANGKLRISLRAGLDSKHHVVWGLNGSPSKDFSWTGSPGPPDNGSEPITVKEKIDSVNIVNLRDGNNTLTITLLKENADTTDAIYFNWVELISSRKYQAYKGALKFRSDSSGQTVNRFYLTGFNSDSCQLLDISDPEVPVFLQTSKIFPAYIQFDDSWKSGNRYFASAASSWLKPNRVEAYQPNRLRELCADVKYLVITADQLWPQAQALLNHHKTKPEQQPALAVKLSWIYNEFGFGLSDPAAIRNFLKYIYTNSGGTSPVWCVLFGNGNYDYRHVDRSIANTNLAPIHQEDNLNFVLSEYQVHSYDDWYAYCDTSIYPQFSIARLPAANSEEAWAVVNKTINYDSPNTFSPWRTQAIMVADDGDLNDTEDLYRRLPKVYNANKVYGSSYPLVGDYKPAARADVIKKWNEGAGIVNFVGHGAWWTWGKEWYFRDTDVPYLSNSSRLPLVITASCGVSRFDNPYYKCINSLVVTKASGGAIASFGSTRESYSDLNLSLNKNLYSALYDSSFDMGRSVLLAKLKSNVRNDTIIDRAAKYNQCYTLLGDPGIRFSQPQNPIEITVSSDTLYNQGRYNINGIVKTSSVFTGRVMLELRDIPDNSNGYLLPGNIIFRGEFPVANDSFQMIVNIPDQLHTGPVPGAKVRAYAWNSSTDAAGVTPDTIWIGGVDPNPDTTYQDTSAPKITVYAGGLALKQDDYLPSQSKFRVEISDQSGINIAPGVSKYGEIKFTIIKDGKQLVSADIAKDFIYSLSNDTLTSGAAEYAYNFTSSGKYTIRVEAYDTRLRKGLWENAVNIETDLKVSLIYNFPNPLKDETYFTFMLSQPGDVTIRIFTVAGNLIREIPANSLNAGYNQIHWNGRDDRGSIPANGAYLYKVTAREGGLENSGFGKLVIMRQ
jgi:hypothetical protein